MRIPPTAVGGCSESMRVPPTAVDRCSESMRIPPTAVDGCSESMRIPPTAVGGCSDSMRIPPTAVGGCFNYPLQEETLSAEYHQRELVDSSFQPPRPCGLKSDSNTFNIIQFDKFKT